MKKLITILAIVLLATSSARIIEVADAGITDKLKAVIAAKNAGGAAPSYVEVGYTTSELSVIPIGNGYIRCGGKFTAPETGVIDKIYIYGNNTSSTLDVKVAIYNDSTGPSTKVAAETAFTDLATWALEWHEFSPVSYSVTASSTYWICYEPSENTVLEVAQENVGSNTRYYISNNYTTAWASPFSGDGDGQTTSLKARLAY